MALTNVQKNVASTTQAVALEILEIKNRLSVVSTMYTTESMTTLTDADYQELAEFRHVTVVEMNAAKVALDAINTAIGDYTAGTNAYKLTKIINTVPQ